MGLGREHRVSTYNKEIGPALPKASTTVPSTSAPLETNAWVLDDKSGYYYNSGAGYYYHKDSAMYFGGDPPAWIAELPESVRHLSYDRLTKARVVSASTVTQQVRRRGMSRGRAAGRASRANGFANVSQVTAKRADISTSQHQSQIGGVTISKLQGGSFGASKGIGSMAQGAAVGARQGGVQMGFKAGDTAVSDPQTGPPSPRLGGSSPVLSFQQGQKRKLRPEDEEKVAKLSKEEEEARRRREAARARVANRTGQHFGLG